MAGANDDEVPIEVYYDGGCPACRREMAHYRAQRASTAIDWVDVVATPERLAPHGLALLDAIARLHVRTADGRWLVGMPAFDAIWRRIPRYRRWAGRLAPLIHSRALARAYEAFCRWRLPRRCRDGVCAAPAQNTRQNTAFK